MNPVISDPLPQVLAGLRVLAISPTPTHPAIAGNRARARALLDQLQVHGATVRLAHILHEPGDITAMNAHWHGGAVEFPFAFPVPRHQRWNTFASWCRRALHVPVAPREDLDDWCDPANETRLQREVASFRPHAILMTYIWNSSLLANLPAGILRVLDAQDAFTDRNQRMVDAGINMLWFSVPRQEEQRALERFDIIFAIQQREAEHFRGLTARPVRTVGHLLSIVDLGVPSQLPNVLIVGSDNPINVDGINWFLNRVWPLVVAARPDAKLHVAGRISNHISPQPNITLHGTVNDLSPLYRESALVASPLRGGTGLKIKVVEAMALGRTVVSTPSAAVGVEDAIGRGLSVAESEHDMAAMILQLLADYDALLRQSHAANAFAIEWNRQSAEAFLSTFENLNRNCAATV